MNYQNISVSSFEKILARGLGRAVLYLHEHDSAPYRGAILDACLYSITHDRQVEGSRAKYMFNVIKATREEAYYRGKILAALYDASDEDWDARQIFEFARLFAESGDENARQLIRRRFLMQFLTESDASADGVEDYLGMEEYVALEGPAGFLLAMDRIGARLLANPDSDAWGHLYKVGEELFGDKVIAELVKQASLENQNIKAYLQRMAERKVAQRVQYSEVVTISYAEIKQNSIRLPAFGVRFSLTVWGRSATQEDLLLAAQDLMTETEESRLLRLLAIFTERSYPLNPARLIALVDHPAPTVAARAIGACATNSDPRMRALAFRLINSSEWAGRAIRLLINNFHEGDDAIVKEWATREMDEQNCHSFGLGVVDFFLVHPNPQSEICVLYELYERTPCSYCRKNFVARLIALNAFPDWMRAECCYDANFELREKSK